MITLQITAANHSVLARQHLTPACGPAPIAEIARDTGGLHATSVSTPYLSLFARALGFRRAGFWRASSELCRESQTRLPLRGEEEGISRRGPP